jgi:hypothetical protein
MAKLTNCKKLLPMLAAAAMCLSLSPSIASAHAGASSPTNSVAAANSFTCMEFVTWKAMPGSATGTVPIAPTTGTVSTPSGGQTVSGATITLAATACHHDAGNAFHASAWSNPSRVCATRGGQTVTVWAIDRFLQIPLTPQRYNRVAGYTVHCIGTAGSVTPATFMGGILPF